MVRRGRWLAPLALLAVLGFALGGIRTGDSASSDPACKSNPSSGVESPSRLVIQSSCAVVTGTIVSRNDSRAQEADGDWTFVIQVDSSLQSTYGAHLQAEIVPIDSITPPPLGTHVRLVGPWVIDTQSLSGFQEIHPVWAASASSCTSGCTTASPPGAPTGLAASPYNGGVSLSWKAPSNNGGSSITGYVITYSPPRASDGHVESVRSGTGTSTTVDGFANGTSYTFTVSALNAAGRGPASSPVSATPFTVPGPPSAVSAKAGNATAQVTWSPPASNGGSAITGYIITTSPGGAKVTVGSTTTQASVNGLANGTSYTFGVKATNAGGSGAEVSSNAVVPAAPPPPPTPQSTPGPAPSSPASTPPAGQGYWMASSTGAIFPFGDAKMLGSTASIPLNKPVVGMAPTPSGNGYWTVATDGGIFNFGDARFFGSTGSIRLNQPIVGMASTPSGNGYYLVASDGGIFTYGDAHFLGSTGSIRLNKPIVGMASTPSGGGYWMVASDGGIFNYGDAAFKGSASAVATTPVVGMISTASGGGYWMATSDGQTYIFGDAVAKGSASAGAPIVAIGRFH